MKNRYWGIFAVISFWAVVCEITSVLAYLHINNGVGAFLCGCAIGFGFFAGRMYEKAIFQDEVIKFERNLKKLHEEFRAKANQLSQDEEPFEEFEQELPFPEVANKGANENE